MVLLGVFVRQRLLLEDFYIFLLLVCAWHYGLHHFILVEAWHYGLGG